MWSILYILGGGVSYVGKKEKGWGKTLNGTIGRRDSHRGKNFWGEDSNPTGQHEFFESDILTKN